jgi:hypothetical protein
MMATADMSGVSRVRLCSNTNCHKDADTFWRRWPACYQHKRSLEYADKRAFTHPGGLELRWRTI